MKNPTPAFKLSIAIACLIMLHAISGCDLNWEGAKECDQVGHGEFVDGSCVCDPGYEGFDCERIVNEKFAGRFVLNEVCQDSGDSYPVTLERSYTNPYLFTITGLKKTEDPIQCIVDEFDAREFWIFRQRLDSSAEVVSLQAAISYDYASMTILFARINPNTNDTVDVCAATLTK